MSSNGSWTSTFVLLLSYFDYYLRYLKKKKKNMVAYKTPAPIHNCIDSFAITCLYKVTMDMTGMSKRTGTSVSFILVMTFGLSPQGKLLLLFRNLSFFWVTGIKVKDRVKCSIGFISCINNSVNESSLLS